MRLRPGLRKAVLAVAQATFLASTVMATPMSVGTALAASPSANLDQCANDPAPSPPTNGCATSASEWVNGNLGSSKSVYREGDSVPYRMTFDSLATGAIVHTVTIEWDTTKSSKHAFDYLTTWNRTVADANPCLGIAGCVFPDTPSTIAIPVDPQVSGAGVTQIPGDFTLWGGVLTAVSGYSYSNGAGFSGDKSASIIISFTATVANPVLAWGGHIASRLDWGAGNSASTISGSPYHQRLIDLDGSGGNQDRSLSADAVISPASITIIKDAVPNSAQDFGFTETGGLTPATFILDDDADATRSNTQSYTGIFTFTTYTFTETTVAGWDLTGRTCSVVNPNGGTQNLAFGASGISIALKEGEDVTCTFTNTQQTKTLSITKTDSLNPAHYDHVGQVITYTITATNTGNVPQTITVSDTPALDNFSCTPANTTSVAPGNSMVCTGTHTVTLADLNAGTFGDNACANASGATQVCATDTVTGTQTKTLSITKTDSLNPAHYDHVGQVITYTITATNTGNVTQSITVSDTPVLDAFSCTPSNGSAILPGNSMVCTGTHTVSQADLNAGTFGDNACANASGATQVCATDTVTGDQTPELSILKTTASTGFSAVGQVISYTITATNTGNVTLHGVDVIDPNGSNLVCVPATPVADLLPGDSIDCTATHTITQADLDAGSFLNTACVDDNDGPAAEACDDVTTTGTQNPDLTITKDATEADYSAVGDVINYTIVATNTGNVALHGVVVTDPKVLDLVCIPATPVDLAPGDSISCTASHTITQADLDARHFLNTACVDDNDGPAVAACDDADVPAHTGGGGGETIIPTQPPTNGIFGGSSGPSDSAWLLVIALGLFLAGLVTLSPARLRRKR
jgi:uncharacterized repeat protein (TIGR01451 family)